MLKANSKVLLFGEHVLMQGGYSLAMPLQKYYGQFAFNNDVNEKLLEYAHFLKKISHIDHERFSQDILQGLHFKSTIPMGSGLGSSGALTALTFAQYSSFFKKTKDLAKIKSILASMEAFFHGTSSGMDPLVSLQNSPILFKNGDLSTIKNSCKVNFSAYLWDSKINRDAKKYIQKFIEFKLQNPIHVNQLIALSNNALMQFITGDNNSFHAIEQLCKFQQKLIPEFYPIDKKILDQNLIKICGAGGGGHFIIFSQSKLDPTFDHNRLTKLF